MGSRFKRKMKTDDHRSIFVSIALKYDSSMMSQSFDTALLFSAAFMCNYRLLL